ncbi:MAG TPA: ACT domain-containing protein [Mesorhizobium sp.]|nr:ACT domain-containing protein [Mesorhizobium sp.]
MSGVTNLLTLLRNMRPVLHPDEFCFCTLPGDDLAACLALNPLGVFREAEGLSLILSRKTAEHAGLACSSPMRAITLSVHSSLEAVGLTAAVAAKLTEKGISANVVAAYHHDHVFVPAARADDALAALVSLQIGS